MLSPVVSEGTGCVVVQLGDLTAEKRYVIRKYHEVTLEHDEFRELDSVLGMKAETATDELHSPTIQGENRAQHNFNEEQKKAQE